MLRALVAFLMVFVLLSLVVRLVEVATVLVGAAVGLLAIDLALPRMFRHSRAISSRHESLL